MLEDLTIETFADRVGQRFRIRLDAGDVLDATLVEATEVRPAALSARKVPFSLVFLAPREPILPQRIYRFEHDDLGAFEIFVVPIGRDESGTRYEAVFS